MLKASELRIGNWIADRGLKEWQIDHWETMNKVSAKPNTMMCSGVLMETHPLTEYVDYLKPIELRENLLLKFGFKQSGNQFYIGNGHIIISWFKSNNEVGLDIEGQYLMLKCKYIHQLQNLYFALAGEELVLQD